MKNENELIISIIEQDDVNLINSDINDIENFLGFTTGRVFEHMSDKIGFDKRIEIITKNNIHFGFELPEELFSDVKGDEDLYSSHCEFLSRIVTLLSAKAIIISEKAFFISSEDNAEKIFDFNDDAKSLAFHVSLITDFGYYGESIIPIKNNEEGFFSMKIIMLDEFSNERLPYMESFNKVKQIKSQIRENVCLLLSEEIKKYSNNIFEMKNYKK